MTDTFAGVRYETLFTSMNYHGLRARPMMEANMADVINLNDSRGRRGEQSRAATATEHGRARTSRPNVALDERRRICAGDLWTAQAR